MACCTNPNIDDYDDSFARTKPSRVIAPASTDDSDESEVLNVDYKRMTPLFRGIEKEDWQGVLSFLNTGRWGTSMLVSSHDHLKSPAPEFQARTWVTCYSRKGEPEWSQLPIHAAISYQAPFVVVQRLCELYPKCLQCTDQEGMLPIHLAFGFGSPENILGLLIESFPESINEKGIGDRYPYECSDLGPNKIRGKVFGGITKQVAERSRRETEDDIMSFINETSMRLGLEASDNLSPKEFILDLMKDRRELQDLKAKARAALASDRSTFSGAASKSSRRSKKSLGQGKKMAPKSPSSAKAKGRSRF